MKKLLILVVCLIVNMSICSAMTNNAGVLGGLEVNSDIYNYLNQYSYRLWRADHRWSAHDMYINPDDSVIVDIWNNQLKHIYLLKSGYKTNKGIEVGMNINDLIYAYGPIYDRTYDYNEECGQNWGYGNGNYSGYFSIEYVSKTNEGLTFIIDKYTNKIVLIRYQKNRHGSTLAISDAAKYILLPYHK